MEIKKLKPIKVKPFKKGSLAGLGKIEGEHVEHEVSASTWKAISGSNRGVMLGFCAPNAEVVQQRFSFGIAHNGRQPRSAKAQAELKAIAGAILKEVNELRKKGVTGRIPLCLQPSSYMEAGLKVNPEETKIHERFHAQNIRRRESVGATKGTEAYDKRRTCESREATIAASRITGIPDKEVSASIPGYWTSLVNWWAAPEELFARAEPLREFCHVRKDKEECKNLTALYHNDIKVHGGVKHPNLIRELADGMHKKNLTAKKVFDSLGNTCSVANPKKAAAPAKDTARSKPSTKKEKTVAKVKKAPKKTAKKTVRKVAKTKVGKKTVKLICTCKST